MPSDLEEMAREPSRTKTPIVDDDGSAISMTSIWGLTTRQRQIMELVITGHPSKNIAADLGISQRTVENHRASIMKKPAQLPYLR